LILPNYTSKYTKNDPSAWSKDSSVGMAIGYGLDGPGSISDSVRFLLFSTASKPTLGPTQPPIQWVIEALFPGVKRQRYESGSSSLSTSEVKKSGAVSPLP
jgi:hypothetical protein